MNSKTIALLAVLLVGVLNSATAGITKKGLEEIPPFSFAFFRFFIAFLCISPFFVRNNGYKPSMLKEIAPISLFATINITFFILGVYLTTANIGSVIYAVVPLLAGTILYLFFKEGLARQKVIGIVIGFLGVLVITGLPLLEKGNPFSGNLLGNLLLTIAVVSWSFYIVYSKKLHKKYSPFMIIGNFIFVTTIILVPFVIWDTMQHFGWWQNLTWWGVFSLLYVGVVITIASYMLYQYAIKHGGSVFSATSFYVTPVMAFIINYFLLGEKLTPGFIVGSLLALVGTALVMRK